MKHTVNLVKEIREKGIGLILSDENIEVTYEEGIEIDKSTLTLIKDNKEEIVTYLKSFSSEDSYEEIPVIKKSESYPISDAQRRLWILEQFEEGSATYNMPFQVTLNGDYDIESFKKAIHEVIKRHEILRTVFKENESGEVRQQVLSAETFDFNVDYQNFSTYTDKENRIDAYIKEDSFKPFDLEKGPLLRASLLQVSDCSYVFYYNMHHIISDGWSMNVLAKDVLSCYEAYKSGITPDLPELRVQYKDYASWQVAQLKSDDYQKNRSYWMQDLSGELPLLDLPTQKLRPGIRTNNGSKLSTYISKEITEQLKAFSQKQDGSLFMGLLACLNVLFYRYTAQEDIIIGTPIAGRDHKDLENQIGFYVNTLALRNQINPEENFVSIFNTIRTSTLSAYSNQRYPFDRLVEDLELKRDTSRSTVFDVMLILQNMNDNGQFLKVEESKIDTIIKDELVVSKFDLEINFHEVGDYLSLNVKYNTDVYDQEMIENLINHFKQLLSKVLENPNEEIGKINYLLPSEEEELLLLFNDTKGDNLKESTFIDLFSDQVEKTPDHTAVSYEGKELTYKELDDLSNQFSHYLKSVYDIGANDLVGILIDRSDWMLVSILGILKSGGAYVPIDTSYPQDRIDYIKTNSNSKVCIDAEELDKFITSKDIYLIDRLDSVPSSTDLAYVIYTSGSTGTPKGVMVNHSSLSNYLKWGSSSYLQDDLSNKDFGLFTSLSFDLTVTSLFLPLINGGKLRIFSSNTEMSDILTSYLSERISCVKLTPAHISLIKELDIPVSHLELAIVGGEALHQNHIDILRNLNPSIKIYNEYGPTESTVGCTVQEIDFSGGAISIGRPISNTQIYILSSANGLQPIGIVGEICIGGSGLARGYFNREDLTAEKFITHPFIDGERLYKTGDLGRWLADGTIEFLGRKDDQVKIRGYRIELGEIEYQLQFKEDISSAVVLVGSTSSGEKELIGYVISEEEQTSSNLRAYLQERLPDYMLPSQFIQLDSMPLTTNGKVDKKSLLALDSANLSTGVAYVAPENEIEIKLVDIWEEVLQKQKIGVNDNFFDLGGQSINATLIISKTQREFNIRIEISEFFDKLTIASLAEYIESIQMINNQSLSAVNSTEDSELVF
jgi:amino acid adenylation domain-containing protein